MADMAVAALVSIPEYPMPGEETTLRVEVVNRTSRHQPDVRLVVFAGDQLLGAEQVSLAAFSRQKFAFFWTPRTVGRHTLTVKLDPDAAVLEFNRSDNFLDQVVVVAERPPPRANLEITEASWLAETGRAGRPRVTIRNKGDAPVAVPVAFRETDGRVERILVGPIAPGEDIAYDGPTTEFVPSSGFQAEVNPRFAAEEVSSLDNVKKIRFGLVSDLAVDKLTFHERKEGTGFSRLLTVAFRIVNNGPGDLTVPFQTTIRLAHGATDHHAITTSSLAVGKIVYVSHTFKRPTSDFEVEVEIDSTDAVAESNEGNNSANWQFKKRSLEADRWVSIGPRRLKALGYLDAVGRLYHIAIDPKNSSTIYIGAPSPYGTATGAGLWKTTDAGANWFPLGDSLETCALSGLAIDPSKSSRVYAVTPLGIYRSDDAGDSWVKIYDNNILLRSRFLIDPKDPNRIVSMSDLGIYRSKDGGVTWDHVLSGGPATDLARDPINPKILYAGLYHKTDTTVAGLYRSVDGGDKWKALTGCPGDKFPSIPADTGITLATSGGTVYMGLSKPKDFKLFKTTDISCAAGGESRSYWDAGWTTTDDISAVKADPKNPEYVYAYFAGGLFYVSTDGGDKFSVIKGNHPHVDHHGYAADPKDTRIIYALNDGGVYRSADHGKENTWSFVGEGICNFEVYDLALSATDPDLVIAGTQDNGTIGYDGSSTVWQEFHDGDGASVAIDPTDSGTMYFMQQYPESLTRLSGGRKDNIACGLPTGAVDGNMPFQLHPGKPTTLLACAHKLYRVDDADCTDNQSPWRVILDPAANAGIIVSSAIDPHTDLYYAGTSIGTLYAGRDGKNWNQIFAHAYSLGTGDLEIDPRDNSVLYAAFAGFNNDKRVYMLKRTADPPGQSDVTAHDITSDLPNNIRINTIAVDRLNAWTLLVGTTKGVYRGHSADDGKSWTWSYYNTGMPAGLDIVDMEVQPKTGVIRAATMGRGIYQISTGVPVGSLLAVQGKLSMLRVHEVGTGYGPPNDRLDGEVVVRIDATGDLALGFQLRKDADEQQRRAMLKVLRDSFRKGTTLRIEYLKTGFRVGTIQRVIELP